MDLSDPTHSIVPTLDGPVLAVLAASGSPMTVGDVAKQVVRGSEIGVRRSLARLVDEGIVRATEMGRNRVHELNRDHIAAPIAQLLAGLRPLLFDRMRADMSKWKPKPHYACVFGSAARGDGDSRSDIDVLLVHVPFPDDPKPPRQARLWDSLAQKWSEPVSVSAAEVRRWSGHVDRLRQNIQAWTGNPAQIIDVSWAEWVEHEDSPEIFEEIRRDGIDVTPKSAVASFLSAEGS